MNKDFILQIIMKVHFMIPRETYLRIYPLISDMKLPLENLERIAIELHEDQVLKDNILLVLTDINDSLTTNKQVSKEDIQKLIDNETEQSAIREGESINLKEDLKDEIKFLKIRSKNNETFLLDGV